MKYCFYIFFLPFLIIGTVLLSTTVFAAATVTLATGGSSISADAASGAYTSLTGPIISEGISGDIGTGTIILNAPAGFMFDIGGAAPTVLVTRISGAGSNVRNINGAASGASLAVTGVTAAQITFTITSSSSNGVKNSLTWQNVRVRPTAGTPLASGNITKTGTAAVSGVVNLTNFGTLTEVAGVKTQLVYTTQPSSSATVGIDFSVKPVIAVRDQFGNIVAQDNSTVISLTVKLSTETCSGINGAGVLTSTPASGAAVTAGVMTYTAMKYSAAESIKICAASSGLVSILSNTVTVSPSSDTTPPSAIVDLTATNPTKSSILLTWTAPGNDGNIGTATSYDIRYSTSNITDANWLSATPVAGAPIPQVAGTVQSMTVSGLSSGTTYFFAIKTSDGVPNQSSLSNIASATTIGIAVTVSWNQQNFWFRNDDGSESTATGFGANNLVKNAVIANLNQDGYNRLKSFRLRIAFRDSNAAGNISPQLEFLEYWQQIDQFPPDCTVLSGWTRVGTSTTDAFSLRNSSNFTDLSSTTQQIAGGANWISGLILDASNPAPLVTLAKNQVTEYEWSLGYNRDFKRGNTGPNFLFRISNGGSALDIYSICPLASLASPYQSLVPQTTITFSGQAFPDAKIIVVEKNPREEKPISQEVVVSKNGEFKISYQGILQTDHSYGLIIEDKDGKKTQTKFYNIDTVSNSLTEKDIFSPPTLDLYRLAVTKGDFLKVIGYASPKNKVSVQLENGISYETIANENGKYSILINTARLAFGKHSLRAKQKKLPNGQESDYSTTRVFTVSASAVVKADLNGDGIIDVRDWSIFLARWRGNEEVKKTIDLNGDGKTDLSDLSIFLRAFRKR